VKQINFWLVAYALGFICSLALFCVSLVGFFVEDDLLSNLFGVAWGGAFTVGMAKWFRDEFRIAHAKQYGGAA
jgi:hypothetical protein